MFNESMAYMFKTKLDVREFLAKPNAPKKVVIMEPEVYVCALYAYHLSSEGYFVKSCSRLVELDGHLAEFAPQVLVLNPFSDNPRGQSGLLGRIRAGYPNLLIVTSGLAQAPGDIQKLMAAGVNAHMDPRATKPRDIIAVVNSLLSI